MNKLHCLSFLLVALLVCLSSIHVDAQTHEHHHHDELLKIGMINQGITNTPNIVRANPQILKNVKWNFKLRSTDEVEVKKTAVEYFPAKTGWYLYSEVEVDDQIGLYRKKILVKNNEFLLSETGEGEVCLSTNCKKIEFANPPEGCKCVEPKIATDKAEVTHRVFFSAH